MSDTDEIQDQPTQSSKLTKARERFRLSLIASADWRTAAREDYRFVQGKQWDKADVDKMRKQGRPCITINRCRPMINQVSGYFGSNMPEAAFLPRGVRDDAICNIAKGVTKYVYDKCMFSRHKKKVTKDRLICGVGYYMVYYDFDYESMSGDIKIDRMSPFEIFVDPESVKEDLSDAAFCGKTTWEDPEELKQLFPDSADELDLCVHRHDKAEVEAENRIAGEDLWFSSQLKKLRVVQYWYKDRTFKTVYQVNGQTTETTPEIEIMAKLGVDGVKKHRIPSTEYRFMTFVDDVVLEDKKSPYKHQRFPIVPEFGYYLGEKDQDDTTLEPAGIIRDLKPVQMELNKMRSQRIDITNKQVSGVNYWQGNMTPEFRRDLAAKANTPGANIEVPMGVTRIPNEYPQMSASNIEMEKAASLDFYTISGINPETMGNNDSPNSMSGVAIDRRQQAGRAQVSDLIEESSYSERLILDLLWGDKGRPGLISQYLTSEQVLRIIDKDGSQSFINVGPNPTGDNPQYQQQQIDSATGKLVERTLYDLSKFEFDIVVAPSTSTPTQLQANLFQLIEAKKAGINVPTEMFLENMPTGNKDELRKKIKENEQNVKPDPPKISLSVAFDDLPVEAKAAVLASQGINVSAQSIAQQDLAKLTKGASVQQVPPQMIQRGPV